MFQRLERNLRTTGDQRDNGIANIIQSLLALRGQDFPLTEGQTGIRRFSDETRERLAKERYIIYSLTGQSIQTLRDAGRPFWSTWHKDYPDFEALQSRMSEVAINPSQLFLSKSNSKTLDQQLEMVARFSQDLSRKVPGVEAVIGEAPDYIELAFSHLDATGKRLFGKDYNYDYARTVTRVGSGVARVGYFSAGDGLAVSYWPPGAGSSSLWAAPLVVPSGK